MAELSAEEHELIKRAGRERRALEAEVTRLTREFGTLRRSANYLAEQYGNLLAAHEKVVMDTPEDRELHAEVIATFRSALGPLTVVYTPEQEGEQ